MSSARMITTFGGEAAHPTVVSRVTNANRRRPGNRKRGGADARCLALGVAKESFIMVEFVGDPNGGADATWLFRLGNEIARSPDIDLRNVGPPDRRQSVEMQCGGSTVAAARTPPLRN
jgi:hypothetical protein